MAEATQLLNAQALGQKLRLSKRQIFRLNAMGKIPRRLKINGAVRWSATSISKWIEMGCPDRATFEARKEGQDVQ